MEQKLGRLLIIGVALAALVVLAGGVWFVSGYADQRPDYSHFHPTPASYHSLTSVFEEISEGQSRGIIELGLLLLIATPVARVLFAMILFAQARDFVYCGISLFVLAVLVFSLAGQAFTPAASRSNESKTPAASRPK
jgi:uncharacterized membrane protein